MIEENKERIIKFFNNNHKAIIIGIGIISIICIFLSTFFKDKEDNEEIETQSCSSSTVEYSQQLENTLCSIISSIDGAGTVKVMVTLENGTETKYATQGTSNSETIKEGNSSSVTQTKESGDTETEYIIIKNSDGKEEALKITEIEPKVKGVVVVCSGGESPVVKERVINAVTTALDLSSNKVCVTKLSE